MKRNVAVLLFLLSLVCWGWYTSPAWDGIKQQTAQEELKKNQLKTLQEKQKDLAKKRDNLATVQDKILAKIPAETHQKEMIILLQQLSDRESVHYSSLSFSEHEAEDKSHSEMIVQFTAEGTSESLLSFIRLLENENERKAVLSQEIAKKLMPHSAERLLRLDSISVNRENSSKASVGVTLRVFFSPNT